jgi:predicted NAD-dependent protein-ADP-ribosyltransferase YbiA (DUF1768 family)
MILFYAPNDPYGPFSNFSRHRVTVYDVEWMTSEHPFQAMKFWPHRPDLVDLVQAAATPGKAALLGRDRAKPLRDDWDSPPGDDIKFGMDRVRPDPYPLVPVDDGVNRAGGTAEPLFARGKDVFMFEIVLAKFRQHAELGEMLLGTGDQPIVEDAMDDPYWGWGASKVGQNKLGRILMLVRDRLRERP